MFIIRFKHSNIQLLQIETLKKLTSLKKDGENGLTVRKLYRIQNKILSMQTLDLKLLQGNKYTFLTANIKQKQTKACKKFFCVLPVKLKPVGRLS